jgi:pimeloyl-ACP methyl ester carboxylesterase
MATFVLVHGGFYGGWCWKKVKAFLEQQGHLVYTPTLTGLGDRYHLLNPSIDLDTHIKDLTNFIFYEDLKDIILVGHSYGGLVITGAAAALPERIGQLIYLDALVPDTGDSLLTLVDAETAYYFQSQAQQKGDGWLIPPLAIKEDDFSPADVAWVKERITPQTLKSFSQKIEFDQEVVPLIVSLSNYPSSFIHCSKNAHPTLQKMYARAKERGWDCFEIESGHFPMIDHWQELGMTLMRIVGSFKSSN